MATINLDEAPAAPARKGGPVDLYFRIGGAPDKPAAPPKVNLDEPQAQPAPADKSIKIVLDDQPSVNLDESATPGLFGTSLGTRQNPFPLISDLVGKLSGVSREDASQALLEAAREPARLSNEGLTSLLQPVHDIAHKFDGEFTNPVPVINLGNEMVQGAAHLVGHAADIAGKASASMLDPETPIVGAGAKLLAGPVAEAYKPLLENVTDAFPKTTAAIKSFFLYRFGQPTAYRKLAEDTIANTEAHAETGLGAAKALSDGFSPAEQQRMGQILKGGISISPAEARFREPVAQARQLLDSLESQAKEQGLLPEETYFSKLSRARVNELNLQKQKLGSQIEDVLGTPKKEQLQALAGKVGVDKEALAQKVSDFRDAIKASPDITTDDMLALGKDVVDKYDLLETKLGKLLDIPSSRRSDLKRLVSSLSRSNNREQAAILTQIMDLSDSFKVSSFNVQQGLLKRADALATAVDNLNVGGLNQLKKFADNFETRFKGRAGVINDIKNAMAEIDDRLWVNKLHGGEPYVPRMYRYYEMNDAGQPSGIMGFRKQKIGGDRFLGRSDLSLETRNVLGEIKEPAYPVGKGITQVGHDIEQARLFNTVATNPEWSSEKPIKDFVQMSDNKALGQLAGKYVQPEIARDINDITRIPGEAEKVYKDFLSAWKYAKVIPNPATHMRNMFSNAILMDLSGVDLTEQPKLLSRALVELSNKGQYYQEAKAAHLLGHEFANTEITGILERLGEPAKTPLGKLMNAISAMAKGAGDVYQKEEQWFKLAKFIHGRELGLSAEAAAADAEKWEFNYGKVSPFEKMVRSSPFGAPFATFSLKAAPRIAESFFNNPLRLYKYKLLFDAVDKVSQEKLGVSDKELATIKKGFGGQTVLLPSRDKNGQLQALDISYNTPWGDLAQTGQIGIFPASLTPMGFTKPPIEVAFNQSLFRKSQRPLDEKASRIYSPTDTNLDKTRSIVDYFYKSFFPSFAPPLPFGFSKGGYSTQKLIDAQTGRPDYFGRIRSVTSALADVFLGLKASPVDPKLIQELQGSALKAEGKDIIDETRRALRNQSLSKEERSQIIEKARTKISDLLQRAYEGK